VTTMMLMNPRIRQIMPAPAGMQELAVQRRTPFSEEEADDIQVWPIVGFALVEEMQRDPNDPHGDEECECELTRVELQVVSAIVVTPRFSEIELTINIFNVDDADWRRVATLKPGEDFDDDWRTAAYEALEEEKARVAESRAKWQREHPGTAP